MIDFLRDLYPTWESLNRVVASLCRVERGAYMAWRIILKDKRPKSYIASRAQTWLKTAVIN